MRVCLPLQYGIAFLVTVSSVTAQERATPTLKSLDPDAIDAFATSLVKDKGHIALSVAIAQDGKLHFARGYGKRSLPDGKVVDKETLFSIGSVTKQFTCVALLLLAEEGKLTPQDKVAKYYPKLTRAADITLYDLMSHTSGYPDYYPLDFVDRRLEKPIALDRLIEEYATGKLDFEPRTRYSYSNTGYIILGRVIEQVSGESFAAFVTRRILKPLGMNHSTFEPAKLGDQVARGYTSFALGDPEVAVPEAEGWLHAAGGLYSTASDLVTWDLALMNGKLLKEESYKLLTTPRELANGKRKGYGGGLGIGLQAGETVLRHTGGTSGFRAYNAMLPRTKSAVIVLSNADHVDDNSLQEQVLALLLRANDGPDVSVPKIQGASPVEAARTMWRQLQEGKIDRKQLGEDYNHFLSEDKVKKTAERLKPLGDPSRIEMMGTGERGGMEVAVTRLTFKDTVLRGIMYRTPDGKVQQFFLNRW